MHRMTLCAAAALLVTTAIQPAAADDFSACGAGIDDEAIAACTRMLARDPNRALVYFMRANVYSLRREYDRGDLRLRPGDPARPGVFQGQFGARRSLKLDPSLGDARWGRERMQALLAKWPNPSTQTNAPTR
jgi:hypothetical protein